VRDEHVNCVLEMRSVDGKDATLTLPGFPLLQAFRHSYLDVAAVALGSSFAAKQFPIVPMMTDGRDCIGSEVVVHGHALQGDAGSGEEIVVPQNIRGHVLSVDGESRGFVNTGAELSVMGMCGGPIVNSDGTCIGLLEGLVPPIQSDETPLSAYHGTIAGCSVYVRAQELLLFIAEIERELLTMKKPHSPKT
jgi:hypothetical protein